MMGATKAEDGELLSSGTQHQNDATTAAAAAGEEGVAKKTDASKKTQRRSDNGGGVGKADPSSGREGVDLEEEAAVGSIHHILKTAFKELYDDAPDERGAEQRQQQSATLASPRPGTGEIASGPTEDTIIAGAEGNNTTYMSANTIRPTVFVTSATLLTLVFR